MDFLFQRDANKLIGVGYFRYATPMSLLAFLRKKQSIYISYFCTGRAVDFPGLPAALSKVSVGNITL